jgi:hypothetical protein
MKLGFAQYILEQKLKNQVSSKFFQCEQNCSMRMGWRIDGRTDMTKLIDAFRNFANAPKNGSPKLFKQVIEC